MKLALEIINLTKSYGNVKVLNGINLSVKEGEFVALLGVNGAGKTSMISSIAGNNKFQGLIKVNGYDVIKQTYKAKINLGVVPQELAFDPFLNVYETLVFSSGLYGVTNNKKWLDEILERLHLSDKRNMSTRQLSGGMKRRLLVAQALAHRPKTIILDEPTAGVDVELRKDLLNFILELNQKGFTILLTSHYLEELEKLCKHVIIIDKGNIIADTNIKKLIENLNQYRDITIISEDNSFGEKLNNFIIQKNDNSYNLRIKNIDELYTIFNILKNSNIDININNIIMNNCSLEEVFLRYVRGRNK